MVPTMYYMSTLPQIGLLKPSTDLSSDTYDMTYFLGTIF